MGMFDYVKVKAPLPRGGLHEIEFHTKDLSCRLDHYTIEEDGSLFVERFRIDKDPAPPEPVDVTAIIFLWSPIGEFKATIVNGHLTEPIEVIDFNRRRKRSKI